MSTPLLAKGAEITQGTKLLSPASPPAPHFAFSLLASLHSSTTHNPSFSLTLATSPLSWPLGMRKAPGRAGSPHDAVFRGAALGEL